jgi:hypothetical protein
MMKLTVAFHNLANIPKKYTLGRIKETPFSAETVQSCVEEVFRDIEII